MANIETHRNMDPPPPANKGQTQIFNSLNAGLRGTNIMLYTTIQKHNWHMYHSNSENQPIAPSTYNSLRFSFHSPNPHYPINENNSRILFMIILQYHKMILLINLNIFICFD